MALQEGVRMHQKKKKNNESGIVKDSGL